MRADFMIGVDPGISGAIALYDNREVFNGPRLHRVFDMPARDGGVDPYKLADLIRLIQNIIEAETSGKLMIRAVVEKVGSMPRQSGAFSFGLYTGIVHGVLATRGIPTHTITPSEWKPNMGLKRSMEESAIVYKNRSRMLATKLFPMLSEQFARTRDDGRAEALLLALYAAKRQENK